ncbi:MAG: hypothetical protein KF744_02570 [Taibaiella sp.]|nr:hypothetical protein [Taibaiella sp.]
MKRFLVLLSMLPLAAIAQTTATNLPNKTPTEIPAVEMPDLHIFQKTNGCGGSNRSIILGAPRISGTIYIIDGVKVETVGPKTKQRTIQSRQPVVIDRIDLRLDMNNPTTLVLQRKELMKLPYTDLTDMVSLSTSAHQLQRGAANHISAGRSEEILYVIDGMQIARR